MGSLSAFIRLTMQRLRMQSAFPACRNSSEIGLAVPRDARRAISALGGGPASSVPGMNPADDNRPMLGDPGLPSRSPMAERQRGPVTMRREQVESDTTDQRLLDSRGPSDWVHTDPWRVLRITSEFVEG